jgi:uncharacterized membrane protein
MSDPNYPPPPPSYTPPPPPGGTMPPPGGGAVSPNRSIMIVLSYLWLLALIPLLVEKNDPEVQWHAKNGLVLTVAEVIAWIAVFIVGLLTAVVHLGCTGCFLHLAVFIIFLVLRIMGIIKGVGGQRFIIPGISQYADRF